MKIQDIFKLLESTSGTNDKIQILKDNKDSEILKEYVYLTESPRVRYYLTSDQIKPLLKNQYDNGHKISFEDALNSLNKVKDREITGHEARDYVVSVLDQVHPDQVQLFLNLLDSDLRCGIGYKAINKVWGNLIQYPEVQLAHTDITKINFPAYSQLKADGVRVLYEDGVFQTRNGSIVETLGKFDFLKNFNIKLDGEFVCYENGYPMDRKTSNGIINKALKNTISEEEANQIVYVVWDMPNKLQYKERFNTLTQFLNKENFRNIKLIESKIVTNIDEAMEHFTELRSRGEEGSILKNLNSLFENKRSFNLCKMKAEYEADLLVTGYELGTGKNENRIGNLLLESSDGKVKTSCGIFKDFPEEIRDEWLINLPKIVTVRYNERITAKGKDTESLFLPRVISVRNDKNEADSLEKMIKEEGAKQ